MALASAGPYAIICTSLQTDNHASISLLSFYRPDALPAAQPTASKHSEGITPKDKTKPNTTKNKHVSHTHTHTTVLWPFFWDHPGEPVPEENFWTSWCKGRLTETDTDHPAGRHSIRTNQCPPPQSPHSFTGRMPFLPPNQQCQSTEGN